MDINDIKIGTILKATINIVDLEKGKTYIVTYLGENMFDYNEIGKEHKDNNYCDYDEALDFFELETITNWRERIQ